jgi:hypothetical protein
VEEDALLTAEVQLYWQEGSSSIEVATGGGGSVSYTTTPRIARYGEDIGFAQEDNGTSPPSTGHLYEDGWDDMESGRYGLGWDNVKYGTGTEFDAFVTCRDYDSGDVVKRVMARRNFLHAPPFRHLTMQSWDVNGIGQYAEDYVAVTFKHFDLRSLSFLQRETTARAAGAGFDALVYRTRLIAHGTERVVGSFNLTGAGYEDGDGSAIAPIEPLTAPRSGFTDFVSTGDARDFDYLLMVLQAVGLSVMACQMNEGIAVHPNGSYSCGSLEFGDVTGALDVVHAANKTPTTHRALFNQAFAQTRAVDHYGDVSTVEGDADSGSFCAAGIWVPF